MEITIVRVGLTQTDLTLEAAERLAHSKNIILHTRFCGCADWLTENGIPFESLDSIYEEAEDFDEHARLAAEAVLSSKAESVCYCVMELNDESVKRLFDSDAKIRVIGAGRDAELIARAASAYLTVSASGLDDAKITSAHDTLVCEIDSRELASEVKIRLMEHYPDESEIYVLQPRGVARCRLTELDRLSHYDHSVSCLIHAETRLTRLERHDFYSLMKLAQRLRDPETGCPWDREQTHESLKRDALEEAYELEDAIEQGDDNAMIEEMGDVLFAIALQTQIGKEHGEFDEMDVITGIVQKMITRHSHVFGKDEVENIDGLMNLWDQAKREEKGLYDTKAEMNAVAKALPALLRAQKVLKRAAKAGFDTPCAVLSEETDEKALGRSLLEIAEWSRRKGIDAEKALQDAVKRYIDEF